MSSFVDTWQVVFGTCDRADLKGLNCTQDRSEFLSTFDRLRDFSEFCVSYLLTYRDFHNGTAGLASIGTACSPSQNSGFITYLNYGDERSPDESGITAVHEFGHSWGAKHDEDLAETNPECLSEDFVMSSLLNRTLPAGLVGLTCRSNLAGLAGSFNGPLYLFQTSSSFRRVPSRR